MRVSNLAPLVGLVVAITACQRDLPPLPQAVVTVRTDLDVPRAVSRLRVDVFREDGRWVESRDYPLPHAEDWPTSFGVFSADESKETMALLRLRAFSDGATRDYLGERFEPVPAYAPSAYATSLDALCRDAPDLPMYQELTLRRGPDPLTREACTVQQFTGSVAARVHVTTADTYRFETIRSVPGPALASVMVQLVLRRQCASTEDLACGSYVDESGAPPSFLSRLTVALDPGDYTLLTVGQSLHDPADITLRWAPAASWGPDVPPSPPAVPPAATTRNAPRLVDASGVDRTPLAEPLPAAAVDRLVRVKLTPGRVTDVRVNLVAACAGVMAQLALDEGGRARAEASLTCNAGPGLEAVAIAGPDAPGPEPLPPPPPEGTCGDSDSSDQVVCVPEGSFVLGGEDGDGLVATTIAPTIPVRLAKMSRFWIDRYEFTVGRFRQALSAGLRAPDPLVLALDVNDGALLDRGPPTAATYTSRPGSREKYPLTELWRNLAQAACAFYGGDLPSEAQWEYAAAAAGRATKASFPWGEAPPTCTRGVFARSPSGFSECARGHAGPTAVDDPANAADVSAVGVVGMAGNASEFTRDAVAPYDAPCWRAAGPIDPECVDPSAPLRTVRGGSWKVPAPFLRATVRTPFAYEADARFGFRCVYSAPPSRTWSGP